MADLVGRVLVVDDDNELRRPLVSFLRSHGFAVESAADGFKALPKLTAFDPDVVLTDLVMPGLDGFSLLRRAMELDNDCAVVVMTGHGAVETAVSAMREGAFDYVTKPVHLEMLTPIVERGIERRRLRRASRSRPGRSIETDALAAIVGASRAVATMREAIVQVAPSRANVLVIGESGTGKELVAAAIHAQSPRVSGPFVALHCAAIADTLLESELFGHERGAFTGAVARREGRFMQAHGGTLFLDEIGEISPSVQVKLLRVLQTREFERVGGEQTLRTDVRIIAATNRDLAAMTRDGRFREDLYYRLNVVQIGTPPLREREGDIPILAMHFLERFGKANDKAVRGFTDDALMRLTQYSWPGNVRELANAIERSVVLCRTDRIAVEDLPPQIVPTAIERPPTVPRSLEEVERWFILKTLEYTGGSTRRAAEVLGISARKIQYKLHQYKGR